MALIRDSKDVKATSFGGYSSRAASLAKQAAARAKETAARSSYSTAMQQLAKSPEYKASTKSSPALSPQPTPTPSPTIKTTNQNGGGSSGSGKMSYDDAYGRAMADFNAKQAAQQAAYKSEQEAYRKALVESKKGAINSEYETNASIIKNNLTRALAALNQNKAALEPLYQRQLSSIAQNQFATSETTKEIMNQGGWNAGNSGLAVGEQTKIGIGADKQRGEAAQARTAAENEYNSQMATEQMAADESLGSLGRWRSNQLSAAESDAMATATQYGRSVYESDRDFAFSQRQFEESVRQFEVQLAEQKASRTAAQKAAIARSTKDGTAQTEYNKFLGALYSPNVVSQKDAEDLLTIAMSDPNIPDNMKEDMIKQTRSWIEDYNVKKVNATPKGATITNINPDWSQIS